MSSFNCEHCGTAIIDTPRGYITSCEHHKAEDITDIAKSKDSLTTWNYYEKKVMDAMRNLHKSQVDIPHEFADVVKELTSNSFEAHNQGNINGKD